MNIETILVATDFSTREPLELATSLARDHKARLLIAHVIEPPEPVSPIVVHSGISATVSAQQAAELKKIVPSDADVAYEHCVVDGTPSDGILKLAKEKKVDLIVMGSHGRTGLKHLLMGSVAEQVVRHADCAVLVVKQPEE